MFTVELLDNDTTRHLNDMSDHMEKLTFAISNGATITIDGGWWDEDVYTQTYSRYFHTHDFASWVAGKTILGDPPTTVDDMQELFWYLDDQHATWVMCTDAHRRGWDAFDVTLVWSFDMDGGVLTRMHDNNDVEDVVKKATGDYIHVCDTQGWFSGVVSPHRVEVGVLHSTGSDTNTTADTMSVTVCMEIEECRDSATVTSILRDLPGAIIGAIEEKTGFTATYGDQYYNYTILDPDDDTTAMVVCSEHVDDDTRYRIVRAGARADNSRSEGDD